jgi:hypothetical protein
MFSAGEQRFHHDKTGGCAIGPPIGQFLLKANQMKLSWVHAAQQSE